MSIPTSAAHANYGSFSMTMIMLLLLSLRCSLEQAMLKVEVLHSWFFSFLWPSKILDLITLFSDCVLLLFLATRTSIKNPYIWFLPTKSFPAGKFRFSCMYSQPFRCFRFPWCSCTQSRIYQHLQSFIRLSASKLYSLDFIPATSWLFLPTKWYIKRV